MLRNIFFLNLLYVSVTFSMTEEIFSTRSSYEDFERISFESLKDHSVQDDQIAKLLTSHDLSKNSLSDSACLTPTKKRMVYYGAGSALLVGGALGIAFSLNTLIEGDSTDKSGNALAFLGSSFATLAGIFLIRNGLSEEDFFKKLFARKFLNRRAKTDVIVV